MLFVGCPWWPMHYFWVEEAISHLIMKDSAVIIIRASNWYALLLLLSLSGCEYWLVQGGNELTWATFWYFIRKQWAQVTFFCCVQGYKMCFHYPPGPRSLTSSYYSCHLSDFSFGLSLYVPGFIVVLSREKQGEMSLDQKCHDYSPTHLFNLSFIKLFLWNH